MKILIIGSKGFIGQYCYHYFAKNLAHEVYGADVAVDYVQQNYFQIDPTNANFKDLFIHQKFDVCINCSGAASVPDSFVHPLRDYELNVHNVVLLLNAIKDHDPTCKFIQLSSAAVYGNPATLPIKEDQALNPLSPYGFHKLQAEESCAQYYAFYGIRSVIVRLFSAYGNGLFKQLFWDLHQKVKTNDQVRLWGTGKESRDFIHVADIVLALEKIIENAAFTAERINIANGEEIYIQDAVANFYAAFKPGTMVEFGGETRTGDPVNWKADIRKLQALGYQQQINFETGIHQYAQWLKELK